MVVFKCVAMGKIFIRLFFCCFRNNEQEESKMAVKPRQKMDDSAQRGLDPQKLAEFLTIFQHPDVYMQTTSEISDCCKEVVVWLGSIMIPVEQNLDEYIEFFNEVQLTIGEYLATASPQLRNEVVNSIRNVIYPMMLNQSVSTMKGVCVMLNILQNEAVEWMIEEGDSAGAQGTTDLKSIMTTMLRWLYNFDLLPINSRIVLMFIKKLEEKKRWDVLTEVSLQEITDLFGALLGPVDIRTSVAPVLFHVLGALRQHPLIIDRIERHIEVVLEGLAWDSSEDSRALLQTVVDMTSNILTELDPKKKKKCTHITGILDAHMTSNSCPYLQVEPWKQAAAAGPVVPSRVLLGLANHGNMCYFNSVMQALALNKTLARHVIMHMYRAPVWSGVSKLFARLLYSTGSNSLNVTEFYRALKPPHFTEEHQHDCSEFLMHLMSSLSAVECNIRASNKALELPAKLANKAIEPPAKLAGKDTDPVARPANKESGSSVKAADKPAESSGSQNNQENSSALADLSDDENEEKPLAALISQSSSSGICKRRNVETRGTTSPKRKCFRPESDTFIQSTFGGVSVTNITCLFCGTNSRRQDTFREIQLAIPEKQDMIQDRYTVQFLLNYYCKTEVLSGENAYRCGICNRLTDAERSIMITKTPKYLLIVLKRFKYDAKMKTHTKLLHQVALNRNLRVGQAVDAATYKLYATVIHTGIHVDMGHYYTLAEENGQWFKLNDNEVTLVDEKELFRLNHSDTPYLLFYRRTDLEEEAMPDISELPEPVLTDVRTHDKQTANRHSHGTRSSTGHAPKRCFFKYN